MSKFDSITSYLLKHTNFFHSIQVKEVNFSYSIDKVFLDIPNLQHGNDGLIYTSVSTKYVPGTDRNMFVASFPRTNVTSLTWITDSSGNPPPKIPSTLNSFYVSPHSLVHQLNQTCTQSRYLVCTSGVEERVPKPFTILGTQCTWMTMSGKGV